MLDELDLDELDTVEAEIRAQRRRSRPDRRPPNVGKPIHCPQTHPLLNVISGTRGAHTLRYADSHRPDVRAKPFGAKHLELCIAITDHHDAALSEVSRRERITRNPVVIEFTKADDGQVATYWARWAGARGETGPWGVPVSMRIAA